MRQLELVGWHCVPDAAQPTGQIAIINTCGFIGDAKQESINTILQFVERKRKGKLNKLYVMGCLSERYLHDLEVEIPEVDGWFGKFNYLDIVEELMKGSPLPTSPRRGGGVEAERLKGREAERIVIRIVNKSDLMSDAQKAAVDKEAVLISAKNGDLSNLRERLVAEAQALLGRATEGVCISGERHYEALMRALTSIRAVQQGLAQNISGEFLSMDLQDVLTALGEVTGQVTNEEVLSNIFSKFCIGK